MNSARWLSTLWWAFRILWACRVSVGSALLGFLLFGFVVQAQNLLTDTSLRGDTAIYILYWAGFFFCVFFLWAFPLHYGARRTLDRPTWILSRRVRQQLGEVEAAKVDAKVLREHRCLVQWVPRLLGLAPFWAIGLGLCQAQNTIAKADALSEWHDAHSLIWSLGVADAVMAGIFLVFIVARRGLMQFLSDRIDGMDHDAPLSRRAEQRLEAVARACLGITFAVYVFACLCPELLSSGIARAVLVPVLLGSLVLPLSVLARCSHASGVPWLLIVFGACWLSIGFSLHFHDLRTVDSDARSTQPRQMNLSDAIYHWKLANGCDAPEKNCPRAVVIATEGGASRAAFMTATAVGAILDRADELGDVPPLPSPGRRIFAISGVSGGAFGATIVSAALGAAARDHAEGPQRPPCRVAPSTWFRGSAAAADPTRVRADWRSCLQALTSGDYLSTTVIGLAYRDVFSPLSDWLPKGFWPDRAVLLERAWERHYDSVVAESSSTSGSACNEKPQSIQSTSTFCRPLGYAATFETGRSWVPLLLLNGTSVETGRRIIASELAPFWSGEKGDRPLFPAAYDLLAVMGPAWCPKGVEAEAVPHCGRTNPTDIGPDILLSTAALASARFPILSPSGNVHALNARGFGGRVVDGGYFENSGLTAARNVTEALHHSGIDAIVVRIANEPEPSSTDAIAPVALPAPLLPIAPERKFWVRSFGLFTAPIDALSDTLQGHGAEAEAELEKKGRPIETLGIYATLSHDASTASDRANSNDPIGRWCATLDLGSPEHPLEMTKLSMSWWLSPTVQADIDAQICDDRNRSTLDRVIQELKQSDP